MGRAVRIAAGAALLAAFVGLVELTRLSPVEPPAQTPAADTPAPTPSPITPGRIAIRMPPDFDGDLDNLWIAIPIEGLEEAN